MHVLRPRSEPEGGTTMAAFPGLQHPYVERPESPSQLFAVCPSGCCGSHSSSGQWKAQVSGLCPYQPPTAHSAHGRHGGIKSQAQESHCLGSNTVFLTSCVPLERLLIV